MDCPPAVLELVALPSPRRTSPILPCRIRPVLLMLGRAASAQRFLSMLLPSTTLSTFNAISSRDRRCGPSELKRRANGGMRWLQCDRTSCFGFLTRSPTQSSRTRASPGPFAVRDNLTLECESGDDADAGKKLADPPLQKLSSQPTLRWREMDSNFQFRAR
jgi:hypothetical protein